MPARRKKGLDFENICLVVDMQEWEGFAMTVIELIYIYIYIPLEPLDCLKTSNVFKQLHRVRPNLRTSILTP